MKKITTAGRVFFGVALAGMAIQQFFYGDFCPILFPHWPNPIRGYTLIANLFNVAILAASISLITGRKARTTALVTGGVLLVLLLGGHVPYEYLVIPYKKTHLALWILPLKELALAGGCFAVAGSFATQAARSASTSSVVRFLEKCIPFGPAFFSTTMICFGISHFLYTQTVADMIPAWIPAHLFWTYFTAVALMAAGVAIVSGIWRRTAALLLGTMILLWFIFLHVPHAIRQPLLDGGNLIFSAFSALAFSGTAFMLAGWDTSRRQEQTSQPEKVEVTALG